MPAKECKSCNTIVSLDKFPNSRSNLDGKTNKCKPCTRVYMKEYTYKNKDRLRTLKKLWNSNNRTKAREYGRNWKARNRAEVNKYNKGYDLLNRDRKTARQAKRRAAKINRTPSWLTSDDYKWIEWYYKQARALTKLTGIPHEVDHIIPLQGRDVSGLHCPINLQILTASDNRSKSNNLEEELFWLDK